MRTLLLLCCVGVALAGVVNFADTICTAKISGFTTATCAGQPDQAVETNYYADYCYGVSIAGKAPYSFQVDQYCANARVFKGNLGCSGAASMWKTDGSQCLAINIDTNYTGGKILMLKQSKPRTPPMVANQCHCWTKRYTDKACTTLQRTVNWMMDGTACAILEYHDNGKPKLWAKLTQNCGMLQTFNASGCPASAAVSKPYSVTTATCANGTQFQCSQPKYESAFCQTTVTTYNTTSCTSVMSTSPNAYATNFCYGYKTSTRAIYGTFSADCKTLRQYNNPQCTGTFTPLSTASGTTSACVALGGSVGSVRITANPQQMNGKNRAILPREEECACDIKVWNDAGCTKVNRMVKNVWASGNKCTRSPTGMASPQYVWYTMDSGCKQLKIWSDANCTQARKGGFTASPTLGCAAFNKTNPKDGYGSITCGPPGFTPNPAPAGPSAPGPNVPGSGAAHLVPSVLFAVLSAFLVQLW